MTFDFQVYPHKSVPVTAYFYFPYGWGFELQIIGRKPYFEVVLPPTDPQYQKHKEWVLAAYNA